MVDFDSNIGLVYSVFNQTFSSFRWLEDDLIQEGMIGLWKACKTFNKTRGTMFSTYAVKCIRNEMYMFLRKERKHIENVTSLDMPIDENKGKTLFIDLLEEPEVVEDWKEHKYVIDLLLYYADVYGGKEIVLLKLKGMKQVDIAKKIGIHQVVVSEKMRELCSLVRKELQLKKRRNKK